MKNKELISSGNPFKAVIIFSLPSIGCHLGASGSVTYNYDYQGILSFKGISEEEAFEIIAMAEIEVIDLYSEDDTLTVISKPSDQNAVKDALVQAKGEIDFITDEVTWTPKDYISLPDEDIEKVNYILSMEN